MKVSIPAMGLITFKTKSTTFFDIYRKIALLDIIEKIEMCVEMKLIQLIARMDTLITYKFQSHICLGFSFI